MPTDYSVTKLLINDANAGLQDGFQHKYEKEYEQASANALLSIAASLLFIAEVLDADR